MSENRIAASSANRSTGCSVTSVASSGVLASVRKSPARRRVSLYSCRYRPAWRISQIGVYSVGSRRSARSKVSLAGFTRVRSGPSGPSERTHSRTQALPAWIRCEAGAVRLMLHVQPGARRSALLGQYGERLKVAVQAPPTDGRANEALLSYLAACLDLRPGALRLGRRDADRAAPGGWVQPLSCAA